MMPYADARAVARMFAALGEPTRLKIATHLLGSPLHVGALAELVGEPMVNVSHHLGVMRQAGLLEDEKRGRQVVYRFRDDVMTPGDGDGVLATLAFGPYRVIVRREPETPAVKPRPRRKPGAE
jgi:DNA-binding transcriptional ArsR family regulator